MASINLQGDTSGSISISAPSVAGSNTLTLPATTQTLATQNALGVRNLIINGDMRIAQRATSVTGQSNIGGTYKTVDRFAWQLSSSMGTWTQEQSTDAPTGFSHSIKNTCTTAATFGANNDAHQLFTKLEGQNITHLKWGTASAQSVTVSFWVKTNRTGIYTVSLLNTDTTNYRQIGSTFTVNSANTWEQKTVTFVGDTAASLSTGNAHAFSLIIWLACGSGRYSGGFATSWVAYDATTAASPSQTLLGTATSDYMNLTAIQLEVGDTATPFEHRPYDMELARCQRYYTKFTGTQYASLGCGPSESGWSNTPLIFPTAMRSSPTATQSTLVAFNGSSGYSVTGIRQFSPTTTNALIQFNHTASAGQPFIVYLNSASAYLALDAEL